MKNYLLYQFGIKKLTSVYFRITNRCNLDCDFCKIKTLSKNNNELTTNEISHLLDDLNKLGIAYLTLTGGEPLIRKDFRIISKKISQLGIYVNLNTNGTLINSQNYKYLAKSFDLIKISIDGDEKLHDYIRGRGSFKKTINGIKLLKSYKKRKAKIAIHLTLQEKNFIDIDKIYNQLKKYADSISIMPAINRKTSENLYLKKQYYDKWKKIRKFLNLNQIGEMQQIPDFSIGKKHCEAKNLYLQILPNGFVTPCSNIIQGCNIGNIKKEKLSNIVKNKMDYSNILFIKNCNGCYSRCTTEISLLMKKNPFQLLKIIPNFFKNY
jgi:MoaA/NifB/PqqE/SkfB family radical SAM enzyme